MKNLFSFWIICLLVLLLAGCTTSNAQSPTPSSAPTQTQIANQAVQPSVTSTSTTTASTTMIPLQDALGDLQPQDVFQNFYAITQIPRPSGYMDQIRPFLVSFGQQLALETVAVRF